MRHLDVSSPPARRALAPALALVALLGAVGGAIGGAGCGGDLNTTDARITSDTGPSSTAHVSASWRVRCDELGDCTGNPARMLDVSNGEGSALVECDARMVGEDRRLEVRFEQPREFGVAISGATTGPTGGRLGGTGCSVDVLESAEMLSLRGQCSANPPSADAPCQIQRIVVDPDARSVSFELRCESLGTVDGTGVVREVTDPDTASGLVEVTLTDCLM